MRLPDYENIEERLTAAPRSTQQRPPFYVQPSGVQRFSEETSYVVASAQLYPTFNRHPRDLREFAAKPTS